MAENFIIELIASLKKGASKKQVQTDAKNLGEIKVPLVGTLKKVKTRAQLKQDLASMNETVNLTGKFNSKGITTSVQQATSQAQKQANDAPVQMIFTVKKEKLINDIKLLAQQNSRLFKDTDMSIKYNTLLDSAQMARNTVELSALRTQLGAFRSELKVTGNTGLTMTDALRSGLSKVLYLFGSHGIIMQFTAQLRKAWIEAKELDSALTDLSRVNSEILRSDFPDYLDKVINKTKELSVATKDYIDAVTTFSRAGYNLTDSEILADMAMQLEKVGDMDAESASKALLAGLQGYTEIDGYGMDQLIEKAQALNDKIDIIGNTASISQKEVAGGIQAVGSVMSDANTSIDEFLALLGAGNRAVQDSNKVALAIRTSALRIRSCIVELQEMGEETDNVIESTSTLAAKIKALTNIDGSGGVNILEADGETFRSIYDIYNDIAKVYDKMSDTDSSALLDLIAGKNRSNQISAILQNMSEANELLEGSLSAAGTASAEYEIYLQSSEAATERFGVAMTETYNNILNGETVKGLTNAGTAVLDFANKWGIVEGTLKGLLGLGILKGITTLTIAFKNSALQVSNYGSALNAVNKLDTVRGTQKYADVMKTLKSSCVNLTDAQLKQVLSNNALSDSERVKVLQYRGLTKAQAQAKLAQMGLTKTTNAQTVANGAAKASTFSLTEAVKGLGASMKLAFMSNPIMISIMALSTIIGVVSSKVTEYNEKVRETRQANMDAATAVAEKADELSNLYAQYEKLSSITNKTSSQEEEFKTVVEEITKALGNKAEVLSELTTGTNEYADALEKMTMEELQSQAVTATVGRKSSEEALQDEIWDTWKGSKVTIDSNSKGKGLSGEAEKAVNIVSDALKEFETINCTWKNISWDISSNDPTEALEFYNAMIKAREDLVLASENDEELLNTEIYSDLNNAINTMSESLDTYIEQRYEEEKLNYMVQNGIPRTTEDYKAMEIAIENVAGSSVDLQGRFKELLTADFTSLAADIESVGNAVENTAGEAPTLSISSTVTQLNTQLKPAFDSLKSAYQSIFTDDEFALNSIDILSTCDAIKSKLDEMSDPEGLNLDVDYSAFEDFVRVLRNSESTEQDVETAFDSLAASITQAALSGAEDFETLKAALEDLGVVNEELVAFEALISNTEALKEALKEAGIDLARATEEQIAAFANEMVSTENASQAIAMLTFQKELYNMQIMNTDGEVANLRTLAENAGYTGEVIKYLTELEQIYQEVASGTIDPLDIGFKIARAAMLQALIKESAGKINYEPKVDFSNAGGGKKSAGKAGKEAADAYLESFEKELKDLDDLKDRGKITEKQYLDALRRLYLKYFRDKEKYLKEYEKYEHQYLDGMKSLYESAFSYITKQIDKRIDAINDEKDAAISALEEQRDARLEEIEAKKEQYETEIEGIEEQIEAKEKEIKAMQDANEERRRSLDLQKAEYDLQRMQNQRTDLVYKDGQMSYQADTSGIRDAKQEVEDIKLEIDISKIEKEIDYLELEKELRQDKIDLLDKEAEKVNKHYDDIIAKEEQRYDAMIKGMEDYKSQFEELTDLLENAQMEAALSELGINMDALLSGSQEEFEKLKAAYVGILADMSRGNDGVLEQLSRLSGVSADSISYLESTKGAFENLGAVTLEGLSNSVSDVKDSAAGLATSAGEASAAVGGIQEGVSGMSESIAPLNTELEKLKNLVDEVVTLLGSIKFPEIGDEGYVQKLRDTASAFGDIALKCGQFSKIDFSAVIGTAASMGDGNAMTDGDSAPAGTGFIGLASAISDAVTTIQGQMDSLSQALDIGNTSFDDQIRKITEEYLPAWEELQARLAEIIGVGGGDGSDPGKKAGNSKPVRNSGGSELGGNGGSIIDIMQTGGDEVASKLEDPWLKAFSDFATDGDRSIQSICEKIVEMVRKMADSIQDQCAAAANSLRALSETLESSGIPSVSVTVSGSTVPAHADGTVGKAFARGTGGYKGLPHDERNALRSEYGQPELTVYPDGRAELTTEPAMGDLPKGTVIFNEEQTEHIMENKGEVLKTYENGNVKLVDGTIITKDGRTLYPLTPDDREYQMIKKFEEYFSANRDAFMRPAYAMNNAVEAMKTVIETINNNNTMNRNEVNIGDIHLHGVQDVNTLSKQMLLRFPNKLLQEMHKQ